MVLVEDWHFWTMRCERSGKYTTHIQKLKRNDTETKKYECLFKLCGYFKANNTWRINAVYGIHNHVLCYKLVSHPILYRMNFEEKENVSGMTLNMVQPKKYCQFWKRKNLKVSQISYKSQGSHTNNKAKRGRRSEMQQMLNLLDDDHYVSRYRVCEDEKIVRGIFWTDLNSIKLFNIFPSSHNWFNI